MQKGKIILIAVVAAAVGFLTARLLIPAPKPHSVAVAPRKIQVVAPAQKQAPLTMPAVAPTAPKMAIVLDDWGNDEPLLKEVLAIGRPMTVAILPHQPLTRRIADEACKSGLDVILHMPMQPKNQKVGLEPHLITVDTPDAEIRKETDEALASVGACVEGVNNHMGSAATSDVRVMRVLLNHLKQKKLFFFDSFVISTSVGPKVAKETGIPFAKRDVFIDNKIDLESVKEKLRQAEKMALSRGQVIVIGHDKPHTIQAIHELVPEIEKAGIQIVPLKTLIKK